MTLKTWLLASALALACSPALAADPIAYTDADGVNDIPVSVAKPLPVTGSVALAPSSASGAAIAPTTSTSAGSNLLLKSGAGNGYRYAITTSGSAGYFMVFDAASAPADGAVTPKICRAVAANSSLEIDHSTAPDRFATGIVEVFSTTGCFTKTASATAELEGSVQ